MVTRFGCTLMTEQSGPRELVRYAQQAEAAGFDFAVCSDHFSPWLASQGHAPYAWSLLGAIAQATERIELMTYITCPTMRYHPAIVAQSAATVGVLSGGRFTLGLGSGENLNEHVVGRGWPAVPQRQAALREAMEIIRELLSGKTVDHCGQYFQVDAARIWDLPDEPVQIGVALTGARGLETFADLADHLIAVAPDAELIEQWNSRRSARDDSGATRTIGQTPICWDRDRDKAIARAHDQFRWFAGGWPVNADLRTPTGFEAATQFVRPEDVAESIPCGADLDAIVDGVRPFWEAGFTDIALIQIGDEGQSEFLSEVAPELLSKLRAAAG